MFLAPHDNYQLQCCLQIQHMHFIVSWLAQNAFHELSLDSACLACLPWPWWTSVSISAAAYFCSPWELGVAAVRSSVPKSVLKEETWKDISLCIMETDLWQTAYTQDFSFIWKWELLEVNCFTSYFRLFSNGIGISQQEEKQQKLRY